MSETLAALHVRCIGTLQEYMKEANKTCTLLSNIKQFPVPLETLHAVLAQRQIENQAHDKYQSARLGLFRAATWIASGESI